MSKIRQLKQQLLKHTFGGMVKSADDLSSDTSFEQSFANLVFAVQNDTAPQLAQHTLGFQLLEKDEDQGRAVGVVGLQLGDSIVLAPYFFKDGEIFGDELLWLADSDLFVPKVSSWINYLINRKTLNLGAPVPSQEARKWVQQADLGFLRKYSIPVHPWALDILPKFLSAVDDYVQPMEDLNDFIKHAQFADALLELAEKYPIVVDSIRRFYSWDSLRKTAAEVKKEAESVLGQIKFRKTASVTRSSIELFDDKYLLDPSLSVPEREEIIKNGFYIRDHRKHFSKVAEVKEVMKVVTENYVTPLQSCVGQVLMQDGTLKEAIYLTYSQPSSIIFLLEPKKALIIGYGKGGPGARLSGVPLFDEKSIRYDKNEILEKLKSVCDKDISKSDVRDGRAICIAPDLHWFEIHPSFNKEKGHYTVIDRRGKPKELIFSDVERPVVAKDSLILPENEALFYTGEVGSADDYLADFNICLDLLVNRSPENYDIVAVKTEGELVRVNDEEMTKKEGVLKLMAKYGMSKDDAVRIVNTTTRTPVPYLVIKEARLPNEGTVSAPPLPPRVYMNDPVFGSNILATTEQETEAKVPGLANLAPPKSPHSVPLNPNIVSTVQQAASTGQKEVFDTAVLQTLLEAADDRDIVDKYLPRFLVGIDVMGRLLFNIYWHYEHFKERYGKSDVERMMNTIRNMFKQLGDTVLTLKEKNISRTSALTPDLLELAESEQ